MIPKKIHYTWFSNEPYPATIKRCIQSWQKLMPDYEFIHWDMNRIANIDSQFLQEAIKEKKWAFAADFVRLWALYDEGGIYLDTDVVCYKSFDNLLNDRCFIGKENSVHINGRMTEQYLTSHCMGAETGHPFMKACLDYYEGRHFVTSTNKMLPSTLRLSMTLLPFIQSEIAKLWDYCPYPSQNNTQNLSDGLVIYPKEYFDCFKQQDSSYCKHLALGSWRDSRSKDEKITLWYKIRWRMEYILAYTLGKCGYILTKKM